MSSEPFDHPAWRERAVLLPLLGAALGLLFHLLLGRNGEAFNWTDDPWRIAGGCFVAVGGIAFAFTVERLRWQWSALFGFVSGLVAGAIFYWNGDPGGGYSGDGWQLIAVLVAIAIAAPLLQAARDEGRWSHDYRSVHTYAWSNVVLWFAAWGFVLITYLLAMLLAELFSLIGLDILKDLTRKGWFGWMLVGAALGGAVAMLRDRDRIMGLLQNVVMTVLSVLAPVLGAGLAVFVLALPVTGLGPLWDQTSATTPILLCCVIGGVLLANSVIGNSAEEESRYRVLRTSAFVLCLVALPLAAVALVSTWLRIDQHGFTPERLWGLVFVGVTLVVATAYLLAVLFGRRAWMASIRAVNVRLAAFVCLIALLLSTPLSGFGAISTRNQLARLSSGEVSAERFDWAALAFDFGPSGRKALERLAAEGPPDIRSAAKKALAANARWDLPQVGPQGISLDERLVIRPVKVPLPDALRSALASPGRFGGGVCREEGRCYLFWTPGDRTAAVVHDPCPSGADKPSTGCYMQFATLVQHGDDWVDAMATPSPITVDAGREDADAAQRRRAVEQGAVEVREVTRRQLFIGGEPVGGIFE